MSLEEILALEEEIPCPGCPVCIPWWKWSKGRTRRHARRPAKRFAKRFAERTAPFDAGNRRRSGVGMPERVVRAGGYKKSLPVSALKTSSALPKNEGPKTL